MPFVDAWSNSFTACLVASSAVSKLPSFIASSAFLTKVLAEVLIGLFLKPFLSDTLADLSLGKFCTSFSIVVGNRWFVLIAFLLTFRTSGH